MNYFHLIIDALQKNTKKKCGVTKEKRKEFRSSLRELNKR